MFHDCIQKRRYRLAMTKGVQPVRRVQSLEEQLEEATGGAAAAGAEPLPLPPPPQGGASV